MLPVRHSLSKLATHCNNFTSNNRQETEITVDCAQERKPPPRRLTSTNKISLFVFVLFESDRDSDPHV